MENLGKGKWQGNGRGKRRHGKSPLKGKLFKSNKGIKTPTKK
jgi:hypothetical protein